MPSRRRLLAECAATVGAALAGCVSTTPDDTVTPYPGTTDETPTATCTATAPPKPTDAAAAPKDYPERPADLTEDSVESFLTAFERAYQYNDALAASPDKIGRRNTFAVRVRSVSIESDGDRYTATVSGQTQSGIADRTPRTTTPATPTETPLPIGHGPFEASYTVTERTLEREGVTLRCW